MLQTESKSTVTLATDFFANDCVLVLMITVFLDAVILKRILDIDCVCLLIVVRVGSGVGCDDCDDIL